MTIAAPGPTVAPVRVRTPDGGAPALDWMQPGDDAGIRRLLRELAMDGDIRLCMGREPSFVDALRLEGDAHDVLVARDRADGRVVGLGSRSVKPGYLNGAPVTIAYLGGLRAHPDYRNGRDFFRAYRMMRQAHCRRPAALTLTTIMKGNARAGRLLTSGRMGLPTYHDLGRYDTLCFAPVRRGRRAAPPHQVALRTAAPADQVSILAFLHHYGPNRQAFPAYRAADWGNPGGLLRNLQWTDMLLAETDGRLVGCAGLWDQRPIRQSIVSGYSRRYQYIRPIWNRAAPALHLPQLPPPGLVPNTRTLATLCVADDNPHVLTALLHFARRQAGAQGATQIAAGFHEQDPMLRPARRIPHLTLTSRIHAVTWPDDPNPKDLLDGRTPYLELGSL